MFIGLILEVQIDFYPGVNRPGIVFYLGGVTWTAKIKPCRSVGQIVHCGQNSDIPGQVLAHRAIELGMRVGLIRQQKLCAGWIDVGIKLKYV